MRDTGQPVQCRHPDSSLFVYPDIRYAICRQTIFKGIEGRSTLPQGNQSTICSNPDSVLPVSLYGCNRVVRKQCSVIKVTNRFIREVPDRSEERRVEKERG